MKRQMRCVHNKSIYPEMGVVCDFRTKNSLCKNCKKFQPRYPIYCCQKCGKLIGLLGRFVEFVCFGLVKHDCKG